MRRRFALAWIFATVALAAIPALAKDTAIAPYYLAPGTIDLTQLLAPPPNLDSPLGKYDEKKIGEALAQRTNADLVQVATDKHRSGLAFSSVLGKGFSEGSSPLTAALFRHVGADTRPRRAGKYTFATASAGCAANARILP